jgi:5'-deoxynucleotidase YfbR-like HD superfamily hydrolase
VAEHCWRVTTLYIELFGLPRPEVLEHALLHDAGELYSGDVPFLAKQISPEYKATVKKAEEVGLKHLNITLPELTIRERDRLKLCDLLQMMEFAIIERNMGNTYAQMIIDNILKAMEPLRERIPDVDAAALNIWCKEL